MLFYQLSLVALFTLASSVVAVPVASSDTGHQLEARRHHKSKVYRGIATYYYQGGNAGACGHVSSDNSKVVALSPHLYGDGSNCGRVLQIKNSRGKKIRAKAMDLCPSCKANHIDLSKGAFTALGNTDQGVLDITWKFL